MRTVLRAATAALLPALPLPAQPEPADPAALVARLAEPAQAAAAEQALVELGRPAVPALLDALGAESERSRAPELRVLRRMGPAAGEVLDDLVRSFRGRYRDAEEFLTFLETFGTLVAYSEKYAGFAENGSSMSRRLLRLVNGLPVWSADLDAAQQKRCIRAQTSCELRSYFVVTVHSKIEDLTAALEHRYAPVRVLAAELLARRPAAEAREAIPALARCLRHDHGDAELGELFAQDLQAQAARALLAIAPEHAEATPAHAWLLRHGAEPQRYRAAVALAHRGGDAAEAVPALREALGDASPRVVDEAITALGAVGPAAADACPALEQLRDREPRAAARCAAALRAIRGH